MGECEGEREGRYQGLEWQEKEFEEVMEGVMVRCKLSRPGLDHQELVFLLLFGVEFIPF